MHFSTPRRPWISLTRQLPFTFEDTSAVNHHFARWRQGRSLPDRQAIDIWSYCYIHRYFRVKLQTSSASARATQDQMIEQAFFKVQRNLENVHRPQRFAHWVSVICKHTFLNHIRQRPSSVPLTQRHIQSSAASVYYTGRFHDTEITYGTLRAAILRLPSFLQQTAHLRFVSHLSYQRISEITGKPVTTVRTYIHKAVSRFKKDPELQLLRDEILKGH
jgi:RNA polymerase sigma factor (sigma-70 family)